MTSRGGAASASRLIDTAPPASPPRVVFLVPRRADGGHRDRLWAWCRRRWESFMPDVPIYEGHHTVGPFNRSAAINTAARLADADGRWDVAVIIDGDVFLSIPNVRAAIASALEGKVTWAHRRWRNIAERHLQRLMKPKTPAFGEVPADDQDMDLLVDVTTPLSWSCCVAVPRGTFDDMGGFDERFRGWGFEDGAWSALVRGLYPWDRVEGDIYHLDHPRSDERILLGEPRSTASADYIRNAMLGRRYMVAALRDHASGDLPGEGSKLAPDRVAQDVSNLTFDDAKFLEMARLKGMPEAQTWAKWWPTLEELRAGAKNELVNPRAEVTLVVHTDGRRVYIEQSIASLVAQVSGPITKRVIYDDSGQAEYKAWLTERFGPLGFYVVGPARRLGFGGSMAAMWQYLDKRCSTEFVFLAEDDFVYDRPVDLVPMIDTLRTEQHLSQIALLRGPAYPKEIAAGGVIEQAPEKYTAIHANGHARIEHREYWTTNPSLFRRSLVLRPWPTAPSSERLFTAMLNQDPDHRAAYWGAGDAWIRHIGEVRAGTGY
jgi:hypothetical protein